VSKTLPHLEGWDCDCLGCRLIRAGVCINCAVKVHAQIRQMAEPGELTVEPCSGACREALEQYFER
jgi:hypothetical protein